jgi:hypothetical protein
VPKAATNRRSPTAGIAGGKVGVRQPDRQVEHSPARLFLVEPPQFGGRGVGTAGHGIADGGQGPVSQSAVAFKPSKRRGAVGQAYPLDAVPGGGAERGGEQQEHQRMQPSAKRRQHVEQGYGDKQAGDSRRRPESGPDLFPGQRATGQSQSEARLVGPVHPASPVKSGRCGVSGS